MPASCAFASPSATCCRTRSSFESSSLLVVNHRAQGRAFNVLHRDEVEARRLRRSRRHARCRVIERGCGGRFLFETAHTILIRGDFSRQDFQRDFAIQARVVRQVDFAHTSRAEQRANLIATELCLGEGHGRRILAISNRFISRRTELRCSQDAETSECRFRWRLRLLLTRFGSCTYIGFLASSTLT